MRDVIPSLLHGLFVTAIISVVSMVLAIIGGIVVGGVRYFGFPVFDKLLALCVELARGTPVLVLMYLVFFGLPEFRVRLSSESAAVTVLAVWGAANVSEVVRGALVSIAAGQREAARAIGLSALQTLTLIVLPQAVERMIPPAMSVFTTLVETSSLASLIGVTELLNSARLTVERVPALALYVYAATLLMYFAFNYPFSIASRKLEVRLSTWL